MRPVTKTQLILQIIGQRIFTFAAIALFATGVGLIAGVDWLVRVAGWAALILWISWFAIVLFSSYLSARARLKPNLGDFEHP